MGKVRIGVIGLGLGRRHVAAYVKADVVGRLVVCDLDSARIEKVRADFPAVAAGYDDVDAMLDAERLDAVSVVTPDHLHRPHAERCLEAGCHVLLTKPLATNLADARAILAAADAAGKVFMVAHERRFRTRFRAIRDLLDRGVLGEIVHLRIDAVQDKRGQVQGSWYGSAAAGRSALVGSGIHEVDLLRFLICRPIASVFAFSNRLGELEFPKDKTTAAVYRFAGGVIGQVTVTYEARWPKGRPKFLEAPFQLIGTRGLIIGDRAAWDDAEDWQTLPDDREPIQVGSEGCVESFLASVTQGAPVAVSVREAFASLAACVAADRSAASGKPTVPAPAPD